MYQEFQLRERPEAINLRNATENLIDEVYTRIVELIATEGILAAGLKIHSGSFPEYMYKQKEVKEKENS